MKPNDKAIEAALNTFHIVSREVITDILTAAYAAQFQSEDYAGLIKNIRNKNRYCSTDAPEAADAIEALLAERDRLKAELVDYKDAAASEADFVNEQGEKIKELKAERDALAARLAPVEDEALVEIVARAICLNRASHACNCKEDGFCKAPVKNLREYNEIWPQARAAIAATRPHIEAAERERCAKIAERYIGYDVSYCHSDSVRSAGYVTACRAIAAAIRSGK